jgi:TRAP-type C4-dicarboxylate transport system substrate-binding protein
VKYATLVPGGLYNTSFFLVMNPRKFNSLSAADQAALMKVSGENFAHIAGKGWDAADKAGIAAMEKDGVQITNASDALIKDIRSKTAAIEADWINKVTAKGVDGVQALKDLRAEIAKLQGSM